MLTDKSLRWSRRLSVVPRWVIVPTIQRQNVAEHSYHVTQTARWLLGFHATMLNGGEQAKALHMQVLEYAMDHDIEEAATGDRPSSSKQGKTYHASMPQYAIIVKVADILEALAFLLEERTMGNTRLTDIFEERKQALREVWGFFQQARSDAGVDIVGGPLDLLKRYTDVLYVSHPGME